MNVIEKQLQLQPDRRMSYFLTLVILGLLFIWSISTIHVDSISNNGAKIAKNILVGLLQPDWALLFNATTGGIPYLLIETMASLSSRCFSFSALLFSCRDNLGIYSHGVILFVYRGKSEASS